MRVRRGHLRAAASPVVTLTGVRTPRLERAVSRLTQQMQRAEAGFTVAVNCRATCPAYPALGDDESYTLDVTADGVGIGANTEWGVLRAFATLVLSIEAGRTAVRLPFVSIEDAPRFPWRGLMLDPARHFLPVDALLRTLDGMALAKLNVLHLHLTDDQGFRFLGSSFPELATASGDAYYTREDIERVVAYAADRGIRIVPEIDMPGHCTSWLASHPEWSTQGERSPPSTRFGVHKPCLDPSNDATYAAIDRLLGDVAEVFPDHFIHIGGDEVQPAWWTESDEVRRYMASIGADDLTALHAHFNARVGATVTRLGKRMVGWDEIAHPAVARDTVVQSWRGAASRDRAIEQGFDCVFSAGYYLDLFYPADIHYAFDPGATSDALAEVERRMRADPRLAHVRDGLSWATEFNAAAQTEEIVDGASGTPRGRVLGGEACLWSEIVDATTLDLRLWERLPAVAERLWSSADCIEVARMRTNLGRFVVGLRRFTAIDVEDQRRQALQAMGLTDRDQRDLAPLLNAVECVKWYARLLGERALRARVEGSTAVMERPYRVDTPLDRFADVLAVESPAALEVAALAARLQREPDHAATRRRLTAIARAWRKHAERFAAIAGRVRGLHELEPMSARLVELADILDRAVAGRSEAADAIRVREIAIPAGEYVLAASHAVAELVTAP